MMGAGEQLDRCGITKIIIGNCTGSIGASCSGELREARIGHWARFAEGRERWLAFLNIRRKAMGWRLRSKFEKALQLCIHMTEKFLGITESYFLETYTVGAWEVCFEGTLYTRLQVAGH
jgi:hypothetical protein